MRTLLARYRAFYGSHPLHLLVMLAGFALFGYIVATVTPLTLWNSRVWWQSIAIWFAAAIVLHDLVLFPIYALADRLLAFRADSRPRRREPAVAARNYIRVPALASGLMLLVFLPGIIEQGERSYLAATGQTQEPFLGRWLLFTAAVFFTSGVMYAIRLLLARRRTVVTAPASPARTGNGGR